jgi:hypothetical protein
VTRLFNPILRSPVSLLVKYGCEIHKEEQLL